MLDCLSMLRCWVHGKAYHFGCYRAIAFPPSVNGTFNYLCPGPDRDMWGYQCFEMYHYLYLEKNGIVFDDFVNNVRDTLTTLILKKQVRM